MLHAKLVTEEEYNALLHRLQQLEARQNGYDRLIGAMMLLPTAQAAQALQISPDTLRRRRKAGEITYIKRGKRVLYPAKALLEFAEKEQINLEKI